MLSNFLPNGGNGVFKLYAVASDVKGHSADLGVKTITADNDHAVKPFGAIDTPLQGGNASGSSFINFGWVLTPKPNFIPTDGSTIHLWVDGVDRGHPVYNNYRQDIALLFPGYANINGATGYFYLNTEAYVNGVHTIQWTATDSAGNTDGIGSRYFTVSNTGHDEDVISTALNDKRLSFSGGNSVYLSGYDSVRVKRGYDDEIDSEEIYPDGKGILRIKIKESERVEVHFLI